MTRETLRAFVRSLSEAELIAALPTLGRPLLLKLHQLFGVENCECELVEIPCGCEEPCGCRPDFKPCAHFKSYYLPWSVQWRLAELLWPDPRTPEKPSAVMIPTAMAVVMERRRGRGEHLYRVDDFIQQGSDLRIERIVKRLRNGAPVAGRVDLHISGKTTEGIGA